MRSRYSAYVLGLRDYVRDTWHPRTRAGSIDADAQRLTWLGLEVLRHAQQDETHATVEFVARYKLAGRAYRMHELSRFERLAGHWVYVDADMK